MKFKNKTLLITGGTGSFGNAILNKFLKTDHFSEIKQSKLCNLSHSGI